MTLTLPINSPTNTLSYPSCGTFSIHPPCDILSHPVTHPLTHPVTIPPAFPVTPPLITHPLSHPHCRSAWVCPMGHGSRTRPKVVLWRRGTFPLLIAYAHISSHTLSHAFMHSHTHWTITLTLVLNTLLSHAAATVGWHLKQTLSHTLTNPHIHLNTHSFHRHHNPFLSSTHTRDCDCGMISSSLTHTCSQHYPSFSFRCDCGTTPSPSAPGYCPPRPCTAVVWAAWVWVCFQSTHILSTLTSTYINVYPLNTSLTHPIDPPVPRWFEQYEHG